MTRRRPISALTAAAALAGALLILALSAAGPVASASADNWNRRVDDLLFPAPLNYNRCTSRDIRLDGRYTWIVYDQYTRDPYGHQARTRILPLHGRYQWLDCLTSYSPGESIYPYYMHRSWITNLHTGGEVLVRMYVYPYENRWHGTGRYEWGSRLVHR